MNDKPWHRTVTAIALVIALLLYAVMRSGLPGEQVASFSNAYLIVILCILGARAMLTELGIRRRRYPSKEPKP